MKDIDEKPNIDFFCLGVFKAATTYIAKIIDLHPEASISTGKEVHYFNKYYGLSRVNPNFDKPVSWYKSFFLSARKDQKVGDVSPMYFVDPEAPKKIKELYPNAKLIICLRDPVQRAYSHYMMEKTDKSLWVADYTFEEVMVHNRFYTESGLYYKQLQKYLEYFKLNQFHFIFFEDIERNPKKVSKDLYTFLGFKNTDLYFGSDKTNPYSKPRIEWLNKVLMGFIYLRHNTLRLKWLKEGFIRKSLTESGKLFVRIKNLNRNSSPYKPLDIEVRQRLVEKFIDDIEKLEKILNRDLSDWKK